MKSVGMLIIFLLIKILSFSQGLSNIWLFGNANPDSIPFGGGVMDFSGGILNMYADPRILNINCTIGAISNTSGQFLFASNGIFIQNASNDTMQNGSGLNPGIYATLRKDYGLTIPQGNLVIPFPSDTTKYYLFHETSDDYNNTYCTLRLYYSIVDMSLSGGLGSVIQKNIILLHDSLVEGRLTACKHANGRDWWLIAHKYNTDLYYKYLITPYGIQGPFTQSIGERRGVLFGQNLFSPDGKLFAYYEPHEGDLDIFDFDRCTGDFTIKAHVDINDSAYGGGAAFSPNSKVLYISSVKYVYQFDLTALDIPASQTTVGFWDGFYSPVPPQAATFYLSYLAPDGKIYINCSNSTMDIHVINNPDSLGITCALCQHCINLPVQNYFTIPNYPNYFLGADSGSVCDSLTSVSEFSEKKFNLNIFPNPVLYRDVTFTYPVMSTASELIINNLEGKEMARYVLPQWSSVQKIKLPLLSQGIYIARLQNGKGKANVKFVVE